MSPSANRPVVWLLLLLLPLAAACMRPVDYSREAEYYRHEPRTVVVLPVRNLSTAVEAPRLFMSTVSAPLIARGYYVFPPELTAEILHAEGIHEGQSWDIVPGQLHRYFGADAVLYVEIQDWDTTYIIVASSVAVRLHYRLVDTRSGQMVWEDERAVVKSSGDPVAGGDALAWLIVSTIDAAVTALTTDYVPLALEANRQALASLPVGSDHADYGRLKTAIAAWEEAKAAEEAKGAEEEKAEPKPRPKPKAAPVPDDPPEGPPPTP